MLQTDYPIVAKRATKRSRLCVPSLSWIFLGAAAAVLMSVWPCTDAKAAGGIGSVTTPNVWQNAIEVGCVVPTAKYRFPGGTPSYRICYKVSGDPDGACSGGTVVYTNSMPHVLSSLASSTTYKIKVLAKMEHKYLGKWHSADWYKIGTTTKTTLAPVSPSVSGNMKIINATPTSLDVEVAYADPSHIVAAIRVCYVWRSFLNFPKPFYLDPICSDPTGPPLNWFYSDYHVGWTENSSNTSGVNKFTLSNLKKSANYKLVAYAFTGTLWGTGMKLDQVLVSTPKSKSCKSCASLLEIIVDPLVGGHDDEVNAYLSAVSAFYGGISIFDHVAVGHPELLAERDTLEMMGDTLNDEFSVFNWLSEWHYDIFNEWQEEGALTGAGLSLVQYLQSNYSGLYDSLLEAAELPVPGADAPTITIEKTHNTPQGQPVNVSITTGKVFYDMGGFDFLIAYDASALSFSGVSPGNLLDTCDWEYFTYRTGSEGNCGTGCPSGMVRIVAVAETNNGPYHPTCFGPPDTDPHELATIQFMVSNDRTYSCQYVPIRFYWDDCGDNIISSVEGDEAYIDRTIYNFDGTVAWEECNDSLFPDSARPQGVGAPDDCLNPDPDKPSPIRTFDFVHGGVDIVCADSIDSRGDLNLNSFGYEIADAVMFTNYFIIGLSAFDPHREGAIAASDANADGVTLSVADLVYLIRVIVGDAQPYSKPTVNQGLEPVTATWNQSADGLLSITSDVGMGAALILADGDVTPELTATNMRLTHRFDGSHTHILVHPPFADSSRRAESFSGGFLRVKGLVASIEFATADGRPVITQTVPNDYVLGQNYPNPFNATTTIRLALPHDGEYTLAVYNAIGQQVARFAGSAKAGEVRLQWDASDQASGVFFYKLTAGAFSETKKMLLLK